MNTIEWLTAVGLLGTTAGLVYAGLQLRATRQIARIEFVLKVYDMMQQYNDVHAKLVSGGEWALGTGPQTDAEWARVDRYMGLFEPVQMVIEDGLVEASLVDVLYGHRVIALAENAAIAKRNLTDRSYRWEKFIALSTTLRGHACYASILRNEVHGTHAHQSHQVDDSRLTSA